ncbi:prenyltransferase [Halorarius halobius]|uniref:prenyltransferase n=1 Tax=Halorarius halobius TaxID=2962671 RepID=UPI0020CF6D9C|nr:prenyltransferase [Halorarius halobius]
MSRRLRALWRMSRPAQLLLVVAVYALGVVIARGMGAPLALGPVAAGLLALLPVAASVHYVNEYADHETDRLTTRTPFSGGSGAVPELGVDRSLALRAATATLTVGTVAAVGLWVVGLLSDSALVLLALIAVLGWQYSVGPLALSRRGLGELDNALLGGVVLPHYGAATLAPPGLAVCLAVLPFALVVFCNLLATQWPDRRADAQVGKYTLPTRWSPRRLRRLYLLVAFLAFAGLVALAGGVLPPLVAAAGFLALPFLLWGAATFTRDERPLPTVAGMVVLAVAQLGAWLWVG